MNEKIRERRKRWLLGKKRGLLWLFCCPFSACWPEPGCSHREAGLEPMVWSGHLLLWDLKDTSRAGGPECTHVSQPAATRLGKGRRGGGLGERRGSVDG